VPGGVDDCRGWDRLCLCELLHFACPGLPVRNRLRPGPRPEEGRKGPTSRGDVMGVEGPGAAGFLTGFAAGSRIAGYRLEEQIGRGGMAVVFRARDEPTSFHP
jgi:hypothetical protein